MKKAVVIIIVFAFVSAWFTPLSFGAASSHICKLTNTLCKNKESCPLKEGHTHKKDAHQECYLTVYNSGDDIQPLAGHERSLQFSAGMSLGFFTPEVERLELQASLIIEEVSHTPPERPPQTG